MTTQYQVRGPDGQTHVFAGPDGASPDQVLAAAQQFFGSQAAAHAKAVADTQAWQASVTPTDGMGPVDRFVAGMGKGTHDLIQGAGERIGDLVNFVAPAPAPTMSSLITGNAPQSAAARLGLPTAADVAESRQIDAPLMATTAGRAGNITGKIAAALPTVFIPGANGALGAGLIGAGQGVLEPTTGDESVLRNAAMGGAGGAAGLGIVKTLGAGARIARAAAQPFYEAGQKQIIGRALNSAAGADAGAVGNRLEQAAAPFVGPSQPGLVRTTMGELVPGSVPTVGQAAENPGISALERAAMATQPSVTNQVSAQLGAQNAARAGVLGDMAGSGGARDFAAAERAGTSDQLYGAARANGVDPAALTPAAQANIAAMQARIPAPILAEAKSLAQINGMPLDDSTSIAGMHYVKQALDDAISSAKAAGNSTRAAALTGLQKDYLSGMDAISPDYAAARATHAAMSEPVNQMDVAQALIDKAQNPLTGAVQPAAFARALNDKTAVGATGFSGATLDNTMTNQQQNLLKSLLADLQRSNAANTAGRGVGSDTVQKLAYANILDQSGVPTFLRELSPAQIVGNVAARGADVAYGRANKELGNRLAETMLSPAEAADAMSAANQADAPNALLRLLAPYLLTGARTAPPVLLTGQK